MVPMRRYFSFESSHPQESRFLSSLKEVKLLLEIFFILYPSLTNSTPSIQGIPAGTLAISPKLSTREPEPNAVDVSCLSLRNLAPYSRSLRLPSCSILQLRTCGLGNTQGSPCGSLLLNWCLRDVFANMFWCAWYNELSLLDPQLSIARDSRLLLNHISHWLKGHMDLSLCLGQPYVRQDAFSSYFILSVVGFMLRSLLINRGFHSRHLWEGDSWIS